MAVVVSVVVAMIAVTAEIEATAVVVVADVDAATGEVVVIEAIAVVESVELPVAKAQQLRVAVARTIVLQATVTRQKAVIDFTRNDDAIFSIT